MRDAEEMAGLAEQLARRFEARVFLKLALDDEPERTDLRRELERLAGRRATIGSERKGTLADALAQELETLSAYKIHEGGAGASRPAGAS